MATTLFCNATNIHSIDVELGIYVIVVRNLRAANLPMEIGLSAYLLPVAVFVHRVSGVGSGMS